MPDNRNEPPKLYHVFSDLEPERDPGSWGAGIDTKDDNEYKTREEAVKACWAHHDLVVTHANFQAVALRKTLMLIEQKARPIYETIQWTDEDSKKTEVRVYRCRGCKSKSIASHKMIHRQNCIWEIARDALSDYENDEEIEDESKENEYDDSNELQNDNQSTTEQ